MRAGWRLFAEKGFHATGTAEIVTTAGVTRSALQHHFPHKADLFLAVFEQIQKDMLEAASVTSWQPSGDGWSQLKTDLVGFLAAATTPEVQRIICWMDRRYSAGANGGGWRLITGSALLSRLSRTGSLPDIAAANLPFLWPASSLP